MLNGKKVIPKYLKTGRLILLSKSGSEIAEPKDTRPIAVLSPILKLLEKVIGADDGITAYIALRDSNIFWVYPCPGISE